MELATPISKLFDSREWAERIIDASDCLECRAESPPLKYPKQHLFHFDLNIIHEWNREQKDYLYLAILSKPELKLITFHMASSYRNASFKDGMFFPNGRPYSREELLLNAEENITWLHAFIGEDISIGVENNNYYPIPAYRYVSDGDFITQVVVDNNISFLFDIAHARITAHNKGISYEDYRSTLPLNFVIQLHICKHGINEKNLAWDAHELPDESILQEIEEIINRHPFKYLTIEYYKDIDNLLQILGRCKKLKRVFING